MAGLDQLIQIIRENRRAEREDKRLDYALASENLRLMYQKDLEKDKMDFQKTTMLWQASKQDRDSAKIEYESKITDFEDTHGAHIKLDDLNITEGYQKFIDGTFNEEITFDAQEIDDMTKQTNAYKSVIGKIDTAMKTKLAPIDKIFSGDYGFKKGDPSKFDIKDIDINWVLDEGKKTYGFLEGLMEINTQIEAGDRSLRNNNDGALMAGAFTAEYGGVPEDGKDWYDIIDSAGNKIGEAFSKEEANSKLSKGDTIQGPYQTAYFEDKEQGDLAHKDYLLKLINNAGGDVDAFIDQNPKYSPYRDQLAKYKDDEGGLQSSDPIVQEYFDSRYKQVDKALYDLESTRLADEAGRLENISNIRDLKYKAKLRDFSETEAELQAVNKSYAYRIDPQVDAMDLIIDSKFNLAENLDLWETINTPGYKGGVIYMMASEEGVKAIQPGDPAFDKSFVETVTGEGSSVTTRTDEEQLKRITEYNMDDPEEKAAWYERNVNKTYYDIGVALNPKLGTRSGKEFMKEATSIGKKFVASVSEYQKMYDVARSKENFGLIEMEKIFEVYDNIEKFISGDEGFYDMIVMNKANRDFREDNEFDSNPDSSNFGTVLSKDGKTRIPAYMDERAPVNIVDLQKGDRGVIEKIGPHMTKTWEMYSEILGTDPTTWLEGQSYEEFNLLKDLHNDLRLQMSIDMLNRNLGNVEDWDEPHDIDGDGVVGPEEIDYFDYLKKKDNSVTPNDKDESILNLKESIKGSMREGSEQTDVGSAPAINSTDTNNAYATYREKDWNPSEEAWFDEDTAKVYGWNGSSWEGQAIASDLYASAGVSDAGYEPSLDEKEVDVDPADVKYVETEGKSLSIQDAQDLDKRIGEPEHWGPGAATFNRGLPWDQANGVGGGGVRDLGSHTGRVIDSILDTKGYYNSFLGDPSYDYHYSKTSKITNMSIEDPDNPNADINGMVKYWNPFMESSLVTTRRGKAVDGIATDIELIDFNSGEFSLSPSNNENISYPHPYFHNNQYGTPGPLVSEGGAKPAVTMGFYPLDNKYKDVLYSLDAKELAEVSDIYKSHLKGEDTYSYDGEQNTIDHFNHWYNRNALIFSSLSDSEFGISDDRILHLPHMPELVLFRREDVPSGLHYYIENNPDMHFVEPRFKKTNKAPRSHLRGMSDYYYTAKVSDSEYFGDMDILTTDRSGVFATNNSDFYDVRYRNANWSSNHAGYESEKTIYNDKKGNIDLILEKYPVWEGYKEQYKDLRNIQKRLVPVMPLYPPDQIENVIKYYKDKIDMNLPDMSPIQLWGEMEGDELNNYIDRLA